MTQKVTDVHESRSLYRWAFLPDFSQVLRDLRGEAEPEMYFSESVNLHSYLHHYFERIAVEDKLVISDDGGSAAFNTGLTHRSSGESIHLIFAANRRQGHQPWFYRGIESGASPSTRSLTCLPQKAVFTEDPEVLHFDRRAMIEFNMIHLLERAKSLDDPRFSESLTQSELRYALERTEQMMKDQPWLARPSYYVKHQEIALLLPLWTSETNVGGPPSAVLVLDRCVGFYRASTILSVPQARRSARLLGRLEHSFLSLPRS